MQSSRITDIYIDGRTALRRYLFVIFLVKLLIILQASVNGLTRFQVAER